jgi:hypothetical protein
MLPALAILVALWFERLAEGAARRTAIWSAAAIPLLIGVVGIAIAAFIGTNHLQNATAIVGPPIETLGAVMLAGSLLTVAAIARRRWGEYAPYVLGATSGALVLFIAFAGEPAAETLKPIPPLAAAIDAQAAPGSTVAVRGVAGTYALIFYTHPGVLTVGDSDAAFAQAICTQPDLYLVTRAADLPALERIAAARGRTSTIVDRRRGEAVLRVDGPACAEGPGNPMSHPNGHGHA